MAKHRTRNADHAIHIDPIIRLWLLRILVPLGGQREFVHNHGFSDDTVAEAIGLGHWIDPSPNDFDPKAVRTELGNCISVLKSSSAKAHYLPVCGKTSASCQSLWV